MPWVAWPSAPERQSPRLSFRLLEAAPIGSRGSLSGASVLGLSSFLGETARSDEQVIPLRSLIPDVQGLALATSGSVECLKEPGMTMLRASGDFLYGGLQSEASDIETATKACYGPLLSLLQRYPGFQLLRLWHYFPKINEVEAGLERYQRFARARHEVLAAAGLNMSSDLPAASAVGSASGPLTLTFLAGQGRRRAIENPRQISAYCYPERYGPRSPSFSRAIQHLGTRHNHLFISGTASIVGHETVAPSNVRLQTLETLKNLEALLQAADYPPLASLGAESSFSIYLREPRDRSIVESLLNERIAPEVTRLFLQGDICRQDLMVEIEGLIAG